MLVNAIYIHIHCVPQKYTTQPPMIITTRCTIVHSAIMQSHVVCLSVCPSVCDVGGSLDQDHIGWKSWKLIAWTISPTSSLLVAQRSSTYSQGNMEKFWGENVRSTPTSITSGLVESSPTKSHVILCGVAVCVCLLLSVHRAVIFATGQLSCFNSSGPIQFQ